MKHPIQQLIDFHYGTIQAFGDKMKVSYPTASKYYHNPDTIRYGMLVKICKKARKPIHEFLQKGIGGEL
jgi:hypothetical protein